MLIRPLKLQIGPARVSRARTASWINNEEQPRRGHSYAPPQTRTPEPESSALQTGGAGSCPPVVT
jgi:hypothetical protein